MNEKFIKDLSDIYQYLDFQKNSINKLLSYLENKEFDKLEIIEKMAKELGLSMSDNLRVSLVTRIVNLRDDSLVQVLKKLGKNESEIIELQEKAYCFVRDFWHEKHKNTIDYIKQNRLLTPFYQEIFNGVYNVGIEMSSWQSSWTAHIINGINKELSKMFDGDDEKVMNYLEENKLFDYGHNKLLADRIILSINQRW